MFAYPGTQFEGSTLGGKEKYGRKPPEKRPKVKRPGLTRDLGLTTKGSPARSEPPQELVNTMAERDKKTKNKKDRASFKYTAQMLLEVDPKNEVGKTLGMSRAEVVAKFRQSEQFKAVKRQTKGANVDRSVLKGMVQEALAKWYDEKSAKAPAAKRTKAAPSKPAPVKAQPQKAAEPKAVDPRNPLAALLGM